MATLTPYQRDVFYGPSIHQSYDIYRHPVRDPGGNPVIVYRHGGGWASNDKRDISVDGNSPNRFATYVLSQTAATDTHFDIVSIETRQRSFSDSGATGGFAQPYDEPAYFPDAWSDAKLAIVHIKSNALTYGWDPKKLVLFGNSAGASILWWSQLTDPLTISGVDSRVTAMAFEKPLVDFRIDSAGVETYSSATDNFYDYAFGTNAGVAAYPGTSLPSSVRQAASVAWYYETGNLKWAVPAMVLSGPQEGIVSAWLKGPQTIAAVSGTPFSSWTSSDKITISANQSKYTESGAAGITDLGYMACYSQGGTYAITSISGGNTVNLTGFNGRARITLSGATVSADGMQITSASLSSYTQVDGDLLWISSGSTNDVVISKTPGAGVMGNAGPYKITQRLPGTNTICIDRSCLRGYIASPPTVTGAVYPVDFAGLSGGSSANWVPVTVKRVSAKPYVDPHDPQQYASMIATQSTGVETDMVSFVPYFQYDGNESAANLDFRHTAAIYEYMGKSVNKRQNAVSVTLSGSAVQ